jgi:hypothetical protein
MLVGITHRIKDPQGFLSRGQELTTKLPDGVKPLQFVPSSEGVLATCIWEGPTVDAVQAHVNGTIGDTAQQEYFAVDTAHASGLPV